MTSMQDFLASATQKAATDLITALDALPAEKRTWKPSDAARSAMDQIAECAILNGTTADTIETHLSPDASFMQSFFGEKVLLATEEDKARALLETNTARVIAAIRKVPASDLEKVIDMPWGPLTIRALCAYPFWNMTYHQGQIVFIRTLLG